MRTGCMRGATILSAAVVAAGSLVASTGAYPVAAADGGSPPRFPVARAVACTENPFTSEFAAYLARNWPGNRFTAAIYDTRTGCQYTYRPDLRITTASVFKIEIMAGILLRAQRQGRPLTATERARIGPMISRSADPEASALWSSLGGVGGMAALERELGLTRTTPTSPWGLTLTTADDRNKLLRQLLLGEYGPFSASTRGQARAFMLGVVPSQRWGVTAGVPSGWRVPLKNGFFTSQCCRWRINSSGVVERPGNGAYAVTILSDGWRTEAAGIAAVNAVSRVIASWSAVPIGPHLNAARYVRRAYADVLGRHVTWAMQQAVAAASATSSTRAHQVVTDLVGTPELDRTGGVVLRLHTGAIGRPPDHAWYTARRDALRRGATTPRAVADELAAHPEVTGDGDLDDAEFVDTAARRIRGRVLSPGLRQVWIDLLATGTSRGALVLNLTHSNEFRFSRHHELRIGQIVLSLLQRAPSAAFTAAWRTELVGGTPLTTLVGRIIASGEYRRRYVR